MLLAYSVAVCVHFRVLAGMPGPSAVKLWLPYIGPLLRVQYYSGARDQQCGAWRGCGGGVEGV